MSVRNMSDSLIMKSIKWLIIKLENGNSMLYPLDHPLFLIKLAELREQLAIHQKYDDWIYYR